MQRRALRARYPAGCGQTLVLHLTVSVMKAGLSICRMAPGVPIPPWAYEGEFSSITRTADELSIICSEESIPSGVRTETGWRALHVAGPLDFSMVGILAALTRPLAEAGIPVLAISTFDTDYLLVRSESLERAAAVLRAAGHAVHSWKVREPEDANVGLADG